MPGFLDTIRQMIVRPVPIDRESLADRQRYAESAYNDRAKNNKSGAIGAYQIMPVVLNEYIAETGDKGNLNDYNYNKRVRDWYIGDRIPRSRTITNGNPTDSVRTAKQYAAYNWGLGNLGNGLVKAKNDGIDIYNTLDWVNPDYLPQETVDYVNFVVRGKDVPGTSKTNVAYMSARKKANILNGTNKQ